MYLLLCLSVFVLFNNQNVFADDVENVSVIVEPGDVIQNVTVQLTNDKIQLKIKVENLTASTDGYTIDDRYKCSGKCQTTSHNYTLRNCKVQEEENKEKYYITALSPVIGPDAIEGRTKCIIQVHTMMVENDTKPIVFDQILHFEIFQTYPFLHKYWPYLAGGGGVLVLLIIIGQTICIIHFKRKAKKALRQESWSRKDESTDDTVRYSKMPVLKKLDICQEARESGIYEALENIQVPVAEPELPSRNESDTPTSSIAGTLQKSKGFQLPFGSLRKNKDDNMQLKGSDNKRTTIERIQERPPMPIPNEEVYEAMDSPLPPRKELFGKKEEAKGFATQPRPKPLPIPKNITGSQTLKTNLDAMSSQIKQAVEHRNRVNTASTALPTIAIPPPNPSPAPFARNLKAVPKNPIQDLPKWKPPPPSKPKQLHPLPPPPVSVIPNPVQTERSGDDSDEEWTYEPLEQYNLNDHIYNV